MWTGNVRAKWHDYSGRAIYHLTLMKSADAGDFGTLAGSLERPFIAASAIGTAIKQALRELPEIHPSLHLYQYALMPDHLHLLLAVDGPLDDILGRKLATFKVRVNKLSGIEQVFANGFNDQILKPGRSLDAIYRYLRGNPYKLAVRRAHPEYFRRINRIRIADTEYAAYGNIQLLDNPFKEQVIVHRADSAITHADNEQRWLHSAANGGVLVSPFISSREKEIRRKAEEVGGRIILIQNLGFGERGKPGAHDFDQCAKGELLILTPTGANLLSEELNRACCLAMNACAETLAAASPCR